MVVECFGEMLFYPETESLEEFHSPEEMKFRIIISTKPPKEYLESKLVQEPQDQSTKKRKDADDDVSQRTEPTTEQELVMIHITENTS